MDYLYSVADKVLLIILVLGVGVLAKRFGWLSDQGEKDISHLSLELTWPCLIFSSIITSLDYRDVVNNLWLPLLCVVIHVVGFAVGLLVCRFAGYRGDRRRLFLFHATMNNYFTMALPFVEYMFPAKGAALLAVANLGSNICFWSLGMVIIAGGADARQTARNILSPCMVATILGIVFAFFGWGAWVPGIVIDAMRIVGQPTLLIGLLIAGCQIYKRGRRALRFDAWNILVGLVRNIVVPALMLCLALALRGHVGREVLVVFMLVAITPVSVTSTTVAMKYDRAPELAAEGVIFTHLLAVFTMVGFVALIEKTLV